MKRKIAAVLILGFFAVLGVFFLLNAPSTDVSYPAPNAYDLLVQAGAKMTPLPSDDDQTQDIDALKSYLAANEDALALVDQAAQYGCRIRLSEMQTMEQMIDHSSYARAPLRLMMVNARLSQLEGRSVDAADQLAKIALIGRRSSGGGLMVHQMIAGAIEREALEGLMQLAPLLDPTDRDRIAAMIRSKSPDDALASDALASDATSDRDIEGDIDEQIDAIVEREHAMTKREYGTLFGSYMIWQLGDSEAAQTPRTTIREQMLEIEVQRQRLVDQLQSAE